MIKLEFLIKKYRLEKSLKEVTDPDKRYLIEYDLNSLTKICELCIGNNKSKYIKDILKIQKSNKYKDLYRETDKPNKDYHNIWREIDSCIVFGNREFLDIFSGWYMSQFDFHRTSSPLEYSYSTLKNECMNNINTYDDDYVRIIGNNRHLHILTIHEEEMKKLIPNTWVHVAPYIVNRLTSESPGAGYSKPMTLILCNTTYNKFKLSLPNDSGFQNRVKSKDKPDGLFTIIQDKIDNKNNNNNGGSSVYNEPKKFF